MSIIIEEPTAEAIYRALQSVPPHEIARLREMLQDTNGHENHETAEDEEAAWYRASARSAARFEKDHEADGATDDPFGPGYSSVWTDEALKDAERSTALLIDERFGPEPGHYD